uniref:Genome polyprotein n=1 Tax=Red panda picorna-like virus TaxID=2864000 RepID=A0A8K1M4I6_9VIRU|nr:hypothetical protein [Red panda picorna-like virus]
MNTMTHIIWDLEFLPNLNRGRIPKSKKSRIKVSINATNISSINNFFRKRAERKKNPWKNTKAAVLCSGRSSDKLIKMIPKSIIDRVKSVYNQPREYLIKLLEDVLLTVYSLFKAKSLADVSHAFVVFIKLRSTTSLTSSIMEQNLLEKFFELFDDFKNSLSGAQLCSDTPSHLSLMRQVLNNFEMVKHSKFVKKLRKFIVYMLSTSLFSSIGKKLTPSMFGGISEEAETLADKGTYTDFVYQILDILTFICERVWQSIQLGNWTTLFHSSESYETWMTNCVDIINKSNFLGNTAAHGIDEHEFGAKVNLLVSQGDSIIKANKSLWKMDKYLHTSILKYYSQILRIKDEFVTIHTAQAERRAPFGILVDGRSSVGKSSFCKILYYHYAKVFSKPSEDHYRYVRNCTEDFWSGFRTNCWCIHIDDVAAHKASICPQGDNSVMELLQIVNQVPFNPNQADLADKGRTPVRAELVTASTNNYHMNLCDYYQTPLAAQRRLKFVLHVQPKESLATNGMLDQSKVKLHEKGHYPDLWDIYLYVVKPEDTSRNSQRGSYERKYEFKGEGAIYKFLQWYTIAIKEHNREQSEVMQSILDIKDEPVCKDCFIPPIHCLCNESPEFTLCKKDIEADLCSGEDKKPIILISQFGGMSRLRHVRDYYKERGYIVKEVFQQAENTQWFSEMNTLITFNEWSSTDIYYDHVARNNIQLAFVAQEESMKALYDMYGSSIVAHFTDFPYAPSHQIHSNYPHICIENYDLVHKLCPLFDSMMMKIFRRVASELSEVNLVHLLAKSIEITMDIDGSFRKIQRSIFDFHNVIIEKTCISRTQRLAIWLDIRLFYHVPRIHYLYKSILHRFAPEGSLGSNIKAYYAYEYVKFRGGRVKRILGSNEIVDGVLAILTVGGLISIAVLVTNYIFSRFASTDPYDDEIRSKNKAYYEKRIKESQEKTEISMKKHVDDIKKAYSIPAQSTNNPFLKNIGSVPYLKNKCDGENVWYKDKFQLTRADLPKSVVALTKSSIPDFVSLVEDNFRYATFLHQDGERTNNHVVGLCGHHWIVNKHALLSFPVLIKIEGRNEGRGMKESLEYTLYEQDTFCLPKSDLMFFRMKNLPPVKDIRKYFPEDYRTLKNFVCHGMLAIREGCTYDMKFKTVTNNKLKMDAYFRAAQTEEDSWGGVGKEVSIKGDCGSPLILKTHYGPIIVGIHNAYNFQTDHSFSIAIDQRKINAYLATCDDIIVDDNDLSTEYHAMQLSELHPRSIVRFAKDGSGKVYGSIMGHKANPKSMVEKTIMHDAWKSLGYTLKHCAPPLKAHTPWHKAFADSAIPSPNMPQHLVYNARKSFVKYLKSKRKLMIGCENVMVYTMDVALNGMPGVKYVDSINRATSTGFPYNHTKKYHLIPEECELHQDGIDIDELMEKEVQHIIENYMLGKRYKPIFTASLKDEPISFEKAQIEKVRVFMGAPFAWTIVVRMYNSWFIQLLQNNKFIFKSAPGCNVWSREWDQFHEYLTVFGQDTMICLDFSSYDKSMVSTMILEGFGVIIDLAKDFGFSKEELLIMQCIAEDTAFAVINFKGDIVELCAGNPSGHPLTVIINCINNILYMLIAYQINNPKLECDSFFENVRPMVYGDDNIMGVNPSIPWFNGVSIARTLNDFGVKATPADKKSEMVEYIPMNECSFLKRVWRWNNTTKSYLAPLDRSSIEKSLMITVKSKSITMEEQAVAICMSAHMEYFMHGEFVFERKTAEIKQVMEMCNLGSYYNEDSFPSWEKLHKRYEKASEGLGPIQMSRGCTKPHSGTCLMAPTTRHCSEGRSLTTGETHQSLCCEIVVLEMIPGLGLYDGNAKQIALAPYFLMKPYFPEMCDSELFHYEKEYQIPWRWGEERYDRAVYTRRISNKTKYENTKKCSSGRHFDKTLCTKHYFSQKFEPILEKIEENGEINDLKNFLHYLGDIEQTHCQCKKCRSNWIKSLKVLSGYVCDHLEDLTYDPFEVIHEIRQQVLDDAQLCSAIVPSTGGTSIAQAAYHAAAGIVSNVAYHAVNQGIANVNRGSAQLGRDLANGATQQLSKFGRSTIPASAGNPETNTGSDEAASSTEQVTSAPVDIKSNNAGGSIQTDLPEEDKEQTTTFHSANAGEKILHTKPNDLTTDMEKMQVGTELQHFLSRPVLIHTYNYATNSSPASGIEIAPWTLYCNNSIIRKKIDNYAFFRGQLKLKIIVNSSPFFYGTVCCTYRPYSTNKTLPQQETSFVLRSQRKNVWVYPQDNAGGEMTLPFFYSRAVSPLDTGDLDNLGTLNITPLIGLRSSNGTPAKPISIKIYAWLDDFQLYGATLLSASSLGVPPTLTVSQKVASSVNGLPSAGLQGAASAVVPRVAPNMSQVSEKRQLDRLTLNNNTTTALGPESVGLPGIDEMDINYICRKEAYIFSRDIGISSVEESHIMRVVGSPQLFRTSNGTGGFTKFCSPMCYIADLFEYWRGDIILRLKFLKTQFHKGRFRLTYDPINQGPGTAVTDPPSRITHIIDIGETDEVEVRLPFLNSRNWASTLSQNVTGTTFWSSGGAITRNSLAFSGYMTLTLETAITAPGGDSSDPISILLFARGAENLEFANPRSVPETSWLNFPAGQGPQSLIEEKLNDFAPGDRLLDEAEQMSMVVGGDNNRIQSSSLVHDLYVGEKIRNLKELATRMTVFRTETGQLTLPHREDMGRPADMLYSRVRQNGIPWCRGVYQLGLINPSGRYVFYAINSASQIFENVHTPYSVYIMAMFCGHRGGFQWVIKDDMTGGRATLSTVRSEACRTTSACFRGQELVVATGELPDYWYNTNLPNSYKGMNVIDGGVEPFFKIVSPNYNRYKFYTVDTRYRDGRSDDDSNSRGLELTKFSTADRVFLDNSTITYTPLSFVNKVTTIYSAADSDWECFYFLNTPPIWIAQDGNPLPA